MPQIVIGPLFGWTVLDWAISFFQFNQIESVLFHYLHKSYESQVILSEIIDMAISKREVSEVTIN